MEFIPDIDDCDFDSEDINDFVLFIENDNELAWGSGNDIDSEYSCYDYIIYTPCEFMNDDEYTEIENEMDVSFLFN